MTQVLPAMDHRGRTRHWRPDAAEIDQYLRRLGIDREPPSPGGLARLHRAQVERVPYETLWIHLGENWSIDTPDAFRRITTTSRGGYCYHVNGAFASLLDGLGYDVSLNVAGVHGPDGSEPQTLKNHVALIVHHLASDENPAGNWYVDVGLGDVLYEPLPLAAGTYEQDPFEYRLSNETTGRSRWQFHNDPAGSLSGVSIIDRPVPMGVFADQHVHNMTSPDSGFARTATCQRRHRTGTEVLRGKVLTTRTGSTTTRLVIEGLADWLDVLGDVFTVRLDHPRARLDELWDRICRAHDLWAQPEPSAVPTHASSS